LVLIISTYPNSYSFIYWFIDNASDFSPTLSGLEVELVVDKDSRGEKKEEEKGEKGKEKEEGEKEEEETGGIVAAVGSWTYYMFRYRVGDIVRKPPDIRLDWLSAST
jgi:hypothetical protein